MSAAASSNMSVSGLMYDNTVDVGSELTCSATGFPAPSFIWADVISGNVTAGFQITVARLGQNVLRCSARNVIRGQEHVETLTVHFNGTGLNFERQQT